MSRSPDRNTAHSRNRSRSRSPLHRQPPMRPSNSATRDADIHLSQPHSLRASDFGIRSDSSAIRSGLMPSALAPGHAFTSLMPQAKPPSAAVGTLGTAPSESSLSLSRDALKLMPERDRLSSLGSTAAFVPSPATSLPSQLLHTANADAVLRDRLLTEHRDRMMLAAAAEYNRPTRATDPALRPELFASHSDNLLGSVGSALAAQSALLRPTLGCPPGMPTIKLPQAYGSIIDPALASLNLPFR